GPACFSAASASRRTSSSRCFSSAISAGISSLDAIATHHHSAPTTHHSPLTTLERISLQQQIIGDLHAQPSIRLLRGLIMAIHVKPDPNHVRSLPRRPLHMIVQGLEHAFAACVGTDVDALDPPEPAIAPVAPFPGHHHLAENFTVLFADEIAALGGI